jgi:hypothetical protein
MACDEIGYRRDGRLYGPGEPRIDADDADGHLRPNFAV